MDGWMDDTEGKDVYADELEDMLQVIIIIIIIIIIVVVVTVTVTVTTILSFLRG